MKIKDIFLEQTVPSTPSNPPAGETSPTGETTPPAVEPTGSTDAPNADISRQFYELINQIRYLDYDNSLALLNLLTKT